MQADRFTNVTAARKVEAACTHFENAWKAGQSQTIEDLIKTEKEPARSDLLRELLALEWALRQAQGQNPQLSEYLERFAADKQLVRAALSDEASEFNSEGVRIRCPYCDASVTLSKETPISSVACPACGRNFSLVKEKQPEGLTGAGRRLGRFQLVEQIGAGAFGIVWSARDEELDRVVALKIPRQNHLTIVDAEGFVREARAAAQMRHPNIVSVHEVGREGDTIFIVSDLVRGVELADHCRDERPSARKTALVCAKIADALQHAHERGVIHRDLKPSNIMLDNDGEPHVMDFGLAKRDLPEVTMTLEGRLLGTPAYMSPEQARGAARTADARSDVYSLGVILFEMLTGERPFRGDAHALMHQVIHDQPPSPRKFNRRVPRDLETICLKCLEKEPEKRFASAAECAEEFRRFDSGVPIHSRPITATTRAWRWTRRNPVVSSLAASVGLLLLFLAIAGPFVAVQQTLLRERADDLLEFSNLNLANTTLFIQNDIDTTIDLLDDVVREIDEPFLFEWHYLRRLCRSDIEPIDCKMQLRSLAFSNDGELMATGAFLDRTVQLWDVKNPRHPTLLDTKGQGEEGQIRSLAFSPLGDAIITINSGDGMMTRWNIRQRQQLDDPRQGPRPAEDAEYPEKVAFFPDGKEAVTICRDGRIEVWDVESMKCTQRLPDGEWMEVFPRFDFDCDGDVDVEDIDALMAEIAAGTNSDQFDLNGDGFVNTSDRDLWLSEASADGAPMTAQMSSGMINFWSKSNGRIWSIAISRDGHDITEERTFFPHELGSTGVENVAISPLGEMLAVPNNRNTVKLYEMGKDALPITLRGHSGSVQDVAFSLDGTILGSASLDSTVRLWNVESIKTTAQRDLLECDDDHVFSRVAFSHDGRHLATGESNGDFKLWDAQTLARIIVPDRLGKGESQVAAIASSPDKETWAVERSNGRLIIWNQATDELFDTYDARHVFMYFPFGALSFSPSGRYLATIENETVKLYDTVNLYDSKPAATRVLKGHQGTVRAVDFSPKNENVLASGDASGEIRIWDLALNESKRIGAHEERIWSIAFSPDGRQLATAGEDFRIYFWDAYTGEPQFPEARKLPANHTSRVFSIGYDYSPNGQTLVSCSYDGTAKLWDPSTGKERFRFNGHEGGAIRSVAFSPLDGKILAAASEKVVFLWRATSEEPKRQN